MKNGTLGTTGITVPRAFLGCGTFGGIGGVQDLVGRGLDRKAAFAALDEALALGIDVLDTSERYAGGESERAIGEWFRQRPRERTKEVRIAPVAGPSRAAPHLDHLAEALDLVLAQEEHAQIASWFEAAGDVPATAYGQNGP